MKILVVDDRPENRLILKTKLKAAGYQVEEASNGLEALSQLSKTHFDLVVTDIMMPEMDGFRLTRRIKTDDALKQIPVLVFTATYLDSQDKALALGQGANSYLTKPAPDHVLLGTIGQLLDQAASGQLEVRDLKHEELEYLKAYNDRLIHKLEDKVLELEQAEQRLRELNASLQQRVDQATLSLRHANQDLEAFAYSASHDLQAPLRGIQGFLGAILDEDPPLAPDAQRHYLERSLKLAAQGQELVNDLLAYARLSSGEFSSKPVDLNDLLVRVLDSIPPADRAGARIDLPASAPKVKAHESALVQVVSNLLTNALKFRKPDLAPHITLTTRESAGFIRLAVQDNGIGIAPEHQERIFKVFERLHDRATYPGSGIGLAIVQRAIEKMGGRTGLESTPGQGSTFWIELPPA